MWKVLVVDDEPANRKLIREVLVEKARCVEVESGDDALDEFRISLRENAPFDIILLDVAMPDKDGIETLKILREIEETHGIPFGKGIPVIMVTAFVKPFMKAFTEGADDYILKPIDPDNLIEKIQKRLDHKRRAAAGLNTL